MVTLAAENVHVELGGRRVLDSVSLGVATGEVLAIVGPNGAGKSTLMNVMTGELAPCGGRAALAGEDIAGIGSATLARRRALMPQRASLTFPFRVADVVAMGREPFRHDHDMEGDEAAVAWAMEATGTDALAKRLYTKLSGGEQQRVQLARVLAQVWRRVPGEPRFLLLDEPTSSLDLAHQHAALGLAQELARDGIGVAAVVHDLNLAALYADRVAVLSGGHLVALGSPDGVLTPDLVSTVFGLAVRLVRDTASGRNLILPIGHSGEGDAAMPLRAAQ